MAPSVAIRAISKVGLPDHMQFSEVHALSNLDQLFGSPAHYPQLAFYFESRQLRHASPCDISTSLKESLGMALREYPLVAGRVRVNKQGRFELVREPGDGVTFIEATTDARLEDWPDLRRCALLLQLNPQDTGTPGLDIQEVPLTKVQATVFECGAVALGFSFAHILTDGMGAIRFLRAWSEIHQRRNLSITPFLARTILKPRDPPQVTVPVTDATTYFMLPIKTQPISTPIPSVLSSFDDVKSLPQMILLRLSERTVQECVEEVEGGPFAYGSTTAHEALCAMLWSCLTRAKTWSSDEEESKFSFPINIRNRYDPRIPEGYLGNAFLQCLVAAKASDIATRHLSYAAKLIHESIQSHTPDFCQSVIDWTELQLRNGQNLRVHFGDPRVFGCTTFVGFPVYDVDFGWGKPRYVSFVQILPTNECTCNSGWLIMPSPDGGRSRDVAIGCYNQKHMDALLNDPLFQKHCDPKTDILMRAL